MYDEFTQNRIAELRMQTKVSARDMSLTLGQNESYINKIENKKALPSLHGLFCICSFFHITPQLFFDERSLYPAQLWEIMEDLKKLDPDTLAYVAAIIRELARRK
ncbi:MAG: helix-turn-helix domain-containing protein [Oscillospiraceae bacterium]|nr:helix-turn-helix domain-containing protein [Oscillospiraceae bacterium]